MTQEQYDTLVKNAEEMKTVEDIEKYQAALSLDFNLKYQILQTQKIKIWDATNAKKSSTSEYNEVG